MPNATIWHEEAIFYNLHVRSFYDSNGDGIGDLPGLTLQLDYLLDLGITCIQLLPFYPSPQRDDGYDVSDYRNVHPDFGTLDDFKALVDAVHSRDMKLVIDFIMAHTSIDHPHFRRAVMAPEGSSERNFYVWSDTQDRYTDAEVLFSDYEQSNWTWDNDAKAYYWHRFYSHQPALNYDNPEVRAEILEAIDFWMQMGVDGMRLIGAPYIFQREGTDGENLPEVHAFLRQIREHIDEHYEDRILVGQTNMWPETAAAYYGHGDECHVNYHFPLMPRLYMALQTEDRFPITDILAQTPPLPKDCRWALFLRNQDDLTLTMVTEEERDYLYRVFAKDAGAKLNKGIRRRLAPLLNNDRRKIELLNLLIFSLPGVPVIYYGDEIGMGDNIYLGDRNGVRTPMQWSSDRNAGFSDANPQRLFLPVIRDPQYRYEAINVENQRNNTASLWWWHKNLITMRRRLPALQHGVFRMLRQANSKIIAFIRSYEDQTVLIIGNLSRYAQYVELELEDYRGCQPVEVFSQNRFMPIGESKYPFTIGAYGYHWFTLEAVDRRRSLSGEDERKLSALVVEVPYHDMFEQFTSRNKFQKQVLPDYLQSVRWFGGKSRHVVQVQVVRYPHIDVDGERFYLLFVEVRYTEGLPETYLLPAYFVRDNKVAQHYLDRERGSVICYLNTPDEHGLLVDALYIEAFRDGLFEMMRAGTASSGEGYQLKFDHGRILKAYEGAPDSRVLRAEQSNTSVIYGDRFFFKIYRKLDADINPDLEIVRFLSERADYSNAPRYGGGVEFQDEREGHFTILGLLQNMIPNQGEAWTATLEQLGRYYERILSKTRAGDALPDLVTHPQLNYEATPEVMQRFIGSVTYERVKLLAQRTADMHIALAGETTDPDFKPEPFTQNYQRSLYAAYRKLVAEKFDALENVLPNLPESIREEAKQVAGLRSQILDTFQSIYSRRIDATKTRVHGDYHLGQVLFDGKDFYIIDFEGEPMYSISERRLKRSPFKDVTGMLRSYHYAAYGALLLNPKYSDADFERLQPYAQQWYHYVRQWFLTAYFERTEGQHFVPLRPEARDLLLRCYTLEKAIYEMGYEMNARPDWLRIPLRGVLEAMER